MKTLAFRCSLVASMLLGFAAPELRAQWIQNSSVGPFNYTDTANWNGGVINNQFLTNVTTGLVIQFPANYTLTTQVTLGWSNNANVTFESASATAQTLKLGANGGFTVSNSLGGTITLGTVANPLIIDLNGGTNCTLGGVAGTSGSANTIMNINAQIIDSVGGSNTLKLGGDRVFTYLLNTNNSFVGPVNFFALRGGGFPGIKPIGSGPSALGAPVDAGTGTISAADNNSNGSLRYSGAGDTSDRNFVFNVGFSNAVANAYQLANAGTGLLKLTGQMTFPTNGTLGSQFIFAATNAPLELDGYIHGTGNANGTFTFICFSGGPGSTSTNRITVTGLTNDFRDFIISNVVFSYNNVAPAGVPCSIGAGTNVVVGGGSAGFGGWEGNAGQGSSLQYAGATNASFTRNIILNGSGFNWALDNAGASNVLTWSNNISWNVNTSIAAFTARYLFINPNSSSTNAVYSYIPDANFNAGGTPIGITLGVANPYGTTLVNGGVVQLLNPTNTFAGGMQIGYGRTVQAMALADIGQPSSIGTAATPTLITENGLAVPFSGINLGSPDSSRGGTFSYIGTNDASTDQRVTVFGPTFSTATVELAGLRNDSPNNSSVHFTDGSSWFLQPQGAAGGTNGYEAVLGGTAKATNTLDGIIPDMTNNSFAAVPNSGHVLVNGSAWRFTANQTYSGTTMVANATLLVDGSLASGLGVNVSSGGVLAGTGTINENINVLTNGTLGAGDGGIGTLTINGNVTNLGNIFMKLDKAAGTNDQLLLGGNNLAYGGNLVVSNIAGTLVVGDSFTLFSAGSYTGSVAAITPNPGAGLVWDGSALGSGVLKVAAGGPVLQPQLISNSVLPNGTFQFTFSGSVGAGYRVWASTNVTLKPIETTWTLLTSNTFGGGGTAAYNDTQSTNFLDRFYVITTP